MKKPSIHVVALSKTLVTSTDIVAIPDTHVSTQNVSVTMQEVSFYF